MAEWPGLPDGRLMAPAAARNREPLRIALTPHLAGRAGLMLEIGSGTGEHAADWAAAFCTLDWQPTDPDPHHLRSISAWRAAARLSNLRAPLALDATAPWPVTGLAGVIAVNVIHISPWAVAQAIAAQAGLAVQPGGLLIFYGPFREGGAHTGEGNIAFDASLRSRDPRWGIRDLEAVAELADQAGFGAPQITPMPANNRLVAFERGG